MKKLSEKELMSSGVFNVVSAEFEAAKGGSFERLIVRHPGAVVILPVNEAGEFVLIRQYRTPLEQEILELPAGTLEPGEEPLDCAKREIQEEIGFAAREWKDLGVLFPAPGFCDERQYLFLATGLFESRLEGDEDEVIQPVAMDRDAVETAIRSGEIQDGKTLAALMRYFLLP